MEISQISEGFARRSLFKKQLLRATGQIYSVNIALITIRTHNGTATAAGLINLAYLYSKKLHSSYFVVAFWYYHVNTSSSCICYFSSWWSGLWWIQSWLHWAQDGTVEGNQRSQSKPTQTQGDYAKFHTHNNPSPRTNPGPERWKATVLLTVPPCCLYWEQMANNWLIIIIIVCGMLVGAMCWYRYFRNCWSL